MATFRQRESGWWQAGIRRRGHPPQSKTFETRRDAEAWARSVESEMDKGGYVSHTAVERTTFTEIAKRFSAEFAVYHYRKREDNKEAWRTQIKHLTEYLGDYSLIAITSPVVAAYRDSRLKLVSGTTVRKEVNLLSKILTVTMQEFGIMLPNGNPVANVRKPQESRGRDRRLVDDEADRLLTECRASRNPWLLPAVRLALETAMRQGELLSMEWQHVNVKRRLVMLIDPEKIKNGEPRAVPLSKAALEVLHALPRDIGGIVLPVQRMTLFHAFSAACKRAGIKDFHFHDLRHEALSRIAELGGFSMLEMAAISGHKTLQMLKRYTHLHAEDLAKKLG
ncbi:MAG: site-specific integrase [Sulfuricella sp.]